MTEEYLEHALRQRFEQAAAEGPVTAKDLKDLALEVIKEYRADVELLSLGRDPRDPNRFNIKVQPAPYELSFIIKQAG